MSMWTGAAATAQGALTGPDCAQASVTIAIRKNVLTIIFIPSIFVSFKHSAMLLVEMKGRSNPPYFLANPPAPSELRSLALLERRHRVYFHVCLRQAGAFAKFHTAPLHRRHTLI